MTTKTITTVEYEFRKIYHAMMLSDGFWQGMPEPHIETSQLATGMLQVVATWEVACRDLTQYCWPIDWWQAFKERWFPPWALQRWPVVWKRITLWELASFPRPSHTYPVRYHIHED